MKLTNEICISFLQGSGWLYNHDKEISISERNKALDNFVKFASDMPTVETEDGEIRPMWLEEIAEQLKADGVMYSRKIVQKVAEEYKNTWTNCSVFVEKLKNKMIKNSQIGRKSFEAILSDIEQTELEYNGGWITCSERLPEESGYYLVTYHDWSDGNFLPKYDDTYVRRLHYQISDHFVGWNYPKNVDDRAENDCHKEVIAWQPLPEPFKGRD